jgi:predicted ThiF/HesA family dinucleotide-utilizing enzyme
MELELVIIIQTNSSFGMKSEEIPICELEKVKAYISYLVITEELVSAVIVDKNAKGKASGKYIPIV